MNSYALVFFSNNRAFAWILLIVTFFDYISGLAGLVSIIISNSVAWLAGLNIDKIRKGYYGFNSLLVGLGLGLFFAATLAQMHINGEQRGYIEIDNNSHLGGARFSLYLP